MKTYYLVELNGKPAYIETVTRRTKEAVAKTARLYYRTATIEVLPLPRMTEERKESYKSRFCGFGTLPTREEIMS